MLKKLYIHNFKSFYHSSFQFGKLNCLIAPNNSGKSNLIEAIEFIDNLLFKQDEEKLNFKTNFRYKEKNTILKAEFEFESRVLVHKELIDYKCNIVFNITLGEINNIDVDIDGFLKYIDVLEEDKKVGFFNYFRLRSYGDTLNKNISNYKKYDDEISKKRYTKFNFKYNHSTLKYEVKTTKSVEKILINLLGMNLDSNNILLRPIDFKHIFSRQSIFEPYYFHAHSIKENQLTAKTTTLNRDGTNLVSFISGLNNEIIEDISTSLIGEVEQVNGIKIVESAYKNLFFIENGGYEIPLQETSDGTVHFVSIMSAILGNKNSVSLLFEEPERHMHMKVLSTILNTMRDDAKQMFFTTHSTEILQQLELDEIVFMFRDYDGDTQGQRAKDIPNITKFMKRYKKDLVEMIKFGVIGEYDE